MLRAATRLQAVHDAWEGFGPALNSALLYNRRLWTLFIDSVLSDANPLPREIRQNLTNIGIFVMQQTFSVMTDPSPQKLQPLIFNQPRNRRGSQRTRLIAALRPVRCVTLEDRFDD